MPYAKERARALPRLGRDERGPHRLIFSNPSRKHIPLSCFSHLFLFFYHSGPLSRNFFSPKGAKRKGPPVDGPAPARGSQTPELIGSDGRSDDLPLPAILQAMTLDRAIKCHLVNGAKTAAQQVGHPANSIRC
ncbi:hypothetical protein AOQ84DRAFT_91649 [Glonium stellatum]|uniref:Uncharacterized protein n=1 Tax=Glonium stellatum TaxID=574774 RepID=A0A8E2FAR6_9PEZI|nr:hypothetical protein AOQ84DRAFT_91649 [Glonium stellatum]